LFGLVVGASANPCTETYAGPYAESDPEIKQMVQFINNSIPEDTIKIYISLHSYGQYVLSPWGHTDEEFPQNYDQMMEVAKGFSTALKKKYNTEFTYGSSSTTLCKYERHELLEATQILNVYIRQGLRVWQRVGAGS